MRKFKDILEKYTLKPYRYEVVGKATIIDTDNGRFVIKEKKKDNRKIYDYLESRNFNYYPKILDDNGNKQLIEYIEPIYTPREQKIMDMIDLVALLHSKTTHFKEIDEDTYKEIYEDITNNINYLTSYYTDIITIIETKVYMSPSEYLLARNITKIFSALNFCDIELKKWYNIVKQKTKQRLVVLHNNLELDHFIRNKNSYLINWDKAKIDIPVFDLYKLYKKHALEFDFSEILKRYESSYLLLEEEKKLFFILIAIPDKIEFNNSEYENCKLISNKIDIIYKTEKFISPYYSDNTKKD